MSASVRADRRRTVVIGHMTESVLHVVFSDSAAGLLRPALRKIDRSWRVLSFPDNLGFGPIDPPDPDVRLEWMKQQLGVASVDWDWLPSKTNAFWSIALAGHSRIVVWVSRRTVMEYSGFLEWVWRLGQMAYDVVDLTDVRTEWRLPDGTVTTDRVTSLGLLDPDQVRIHALLKGAARLSAPMRNYYRQMWQQLRTENAALRIIREDRLRSAPITYFDDLLYACASDQWLKVARVVGHALVESWDDHGIQTSDLVLGARVRALAEVGQLEARGDLADWQQGEVRLPAPQREGADSPAT
jgi:Protein of unknown function/Domain of unknown function (DUF1835)